MFEVVHRSRKDRERQRGIRDIKITKLKCFCKAFAEALTSFCTTTSFTPLRLVFERKRNKLDV